MRSSTQPSVTIPNTCERPSLTVSFSFFALVSHHRCLVPPSPVVRTLRSESAVKCTWLAPPFVPMNVRKPHAAWVFVQVRLIFTPCFIPRPAGFVYVVHDDGAVRVDASSCGISAEDLSAFSMPGRLETPVPNTRRKLQVCGCAPSPSPLYSQAATASHSLSPVTCCICCAEPLPDLVLFSEAIHVLPRWLACGLPRVAMSMSYYTRGFHAGGHWRRDKCPQRRQRKQWY